MTTTVTDRPEQSCYEILVDGEPAGFAQYRLHDGVAVFVHTEVASGFEGQGVASTLIGEALDDVRSRGLAVQPFCPFVREYIGRHPEYKDLVREADRSRFDLE
jgi:Predicted acetyltransferase